MNMYEDVQTWSPFVGCRFDCGYCEPSFKRMVRRVFYCQGKKCWGCRDFSPHEHPDRLKSIPSGHLIWPCAHGDISFANPVFVRQIIAITRHHPHREFQWQTKDPACFQQYLGDFPRNTTLLTTLETNRDDGYRAISKAPLPSKRACDFQSLKWLRKILTIEPIIDFDPEEFLRIIMEINPEAVYIGYNSKPKAFGLREPSLLKTQAFIENLTQSGIEVREKLMRQAIAPILPRKPKGKRKTK
jgi:hypothetical protein